MSRSTLRRLRIGSREGKPKLLLWLRRLPGHLQNPPLPYWRQCLVNVHGDTMTAKIQTERLPFMAGHSRTLFCFFNPPMRMEYRIPGLSDGGWMFRS